MRLLIVEDDLDLNEGLAFAFSAEGYSVISSHGYIEGLKIYNNENIDLIILDCNLPDGNGFEFCKIIRNESKTPIIMLTARDTEIDELKGLEIGADDYITKPFSIAILKLRVKKALSKKENNDL